MLNPSVVSSAIFGARSVDKTWTQGDPTRALIAAGQFEKVGAYVTKLDNELGKSAKSAADALKIASKNEKLLEYAGKVVNFASKNVNPLICVSAGYRVLTADDTQTALIQNATGLGAMFGVEHLMKKHLDDIPKMKCMQGVSKKVMEFATKHKMEGKLPAIIHGVAFVVGSCTAYSLGDKFGTMVASRVKN